MTKTASNPAISKHSQVNKLIYIILIALILIASACQYSERSEFTDITPYGWIYGDTVYFTQSATDAKGHPVNPDSVCMANGDLEIVIRHNNHYEYSNIWLELKYTGADSIMTDTLNIELADPYGKWLGKGIGVSYQRAVTVLDSVSIDINKPIKLTHIMRADTLRDIEQVGIVFRQKN